MENLWYEGNMIDNVWEEVGIRCSLDNCFLSNFRFWYVFDFF